MNVKTALQQLGAMVKDVGPKMFKRAKLAQFVLNNKQWLADSHSGDRKSAVTELEGKYFPELSKAFGLGRLIKLLESFPTEEQWQEYDYNLTRLWAEYEETLAAARGERPVTERRRATREDLKRALELEAENKRLREENERLAKEVAKLQNDNTSLRTENARLGGKIEVLTGKKGGEAA